MLDTRNIKEFVRPQLLINAVNSFSQEKNIIFSDWNKTDKNFVVSKLLEEHIGMVCGKTETMEKLIETAKKVGYPTDKKILILSDEFNPAFYLIDPFTDSHIRFSFGFFEEKIHVVASMVIERLDDESKPFDFKSPVIDSEVFEKRISGIIRNEDPRTSFIAMCLGAANIFTYLLFVDVETVEVPPKKKFQAKKYEDFVNKQDESIRVADLSWSKEAIASIPFGVSGHFRVQPFGEGRIKWRLIYINPYYKSGYLRKSGKEKILGKK